MNETPQQYTARITGYLKGQKPLTIQAATAGKLARLIKGVSVSRLRKRPAPGKWSVAEILAHLADTELVGGFRIRMILGAPGTAITAFDQDAWVTSGHYDFDLVSYWSEKWRNGNGSLSDLRVNSSPGALSAYETGIADPFFTSVPEFSCG